MKRHQQCLPEFDIKNYLLPALQMSKALVMRVREKTSVSAWLNRGARLWHGKTQYHFRREQTNVRQEFLASPKYCPVVEGSMLYEFRTNLRNQAVMTWN